MAARPHASARPCGLSLTTSGPELLFPDSPSMARVQSTWDSQQPIWDSADHSCSHVPASPEGQLPDRSYLGLGCRGIEAKLLPSPGGRRAPPSRSLTEPGKEARPMVPWDGPCRPEHKVVHPADPELVGGVDR